jgi:hypothetical protein
MEIHGGFDHAKVLRNAQVSALLSNGTGTGVAWRCQSLVSKSTGTGVTERCQSGVSLE